MANVKKLLAWNLKQPLEHRISLEEVESKEKMARVRGNNAALLEQIHLEIAEKLEVMHKADDFLENRRHEGQGFIFNHSDSHYSSHIYKMADANSQEPTDLGKLNDPRFALVVRCQELAEKQQEERINEDF